MVPVYLEGLIKRWTQRAADLSYQVSITDNASF